MQNARPVVRFEIFILALKSDIPDRGLFFNPVLALEKGVTEFAFIMQLKSGISGKIIPQSKKAAGILLPAARSFEWN